jgi:hypothetical protein
MKMIFIVSFYMYVRGKRRKREVKIIFLRFIDERINLHKNRKQDGH